MQHYIDTLKPEYNVLQIAGSLLGYKHIEESIIKMKEAAKKKQIVQVLITLCMVSIIPKNPSFVLAPFLDRRVSVCDSR